MIGACPFYPPKADINRGDDHVSFGPKPAVSNRSKRLTYSITQSARNSSDEQLELVRLPTM
jgi:hypothetical protein